MKAVIVAEPAQFPARQAPGSRRQVSAGDRGGNPGQSIHRPEHFTPHHPPDDQCQHGEGRQAKGQQAVCLGHGPAFVFGR